MQVAFKRGVLVASLLMAATLAAAPPSYIPIASARTQKQGTTVTVLGLVTVPSGDFRSSSADEGFAIQDQTAGIWVSIAKKDRRLRRGQKVLVTGKLGTSAGKLQIAPAGLSDIQVQPGSDLRVATGQVGVATLGYVVTIEGTITQDPVPDHPYGYRLIVDDGTGPVQVYLNASTDIDPRAPYLKAGRRVRATGFGNQYDKTYEVDPRSRRDLVALP
jgi:DNA/RNA endonuclease YhcR with UshA esterase domain